ncbi:MAG: sensor histidine kinase [Candidatus Merdisoma sp.]|jgi:signal transduction histidine kinase
MKKSAERKFPRNGLSIKQKVTLWYACMLVLIVLLLFGFIFSISRSLLQRESDSRLEELVLDFADEIDFENGVYELDDDVRFYENGVIFSIYDEQGRLIAGSVPTGFPADTTLKAFSFQTFSASGNAWSVYDAALPYGEEQILWIRGILPSETLFSVERTLFFVLLVACPLLIAVALLVGYSITRRAFLPIEEIRRTAETIGAGGDLSARIPTERTQGEIRQLAETFNEMFGRLETSFEHERQFTSDASHELRTPVAVITSQAEYSLLPDATPEEQREGLEVILEQAQKMSALISQLLMLARADNGTQQLTMAPVDLSLLASMTAEQCREAAARRQIRLDCEIAPGIMTEGDQASLVRVFLNLLENAIQYGRPGGFVKLTLAVQNDFAVCSIADDGIGIARENLERIWQRFYRVDPSRNPGGSNTGLGLSLVKWIIEAHHGTIEAESGLGKGSCFTFRLPLQPPAKKAPQG